MPTISFLYFIIKRAAIPVISMIFYKHPLRLRIARQQSNPGHQTWQKQLRIRNEIRYAPGALVLAFAWIIVCLYLQAPGSHQRKAKAGSLLSLGSIMKYTKYNKTAYLISKTDARSLSLNLYLRMIEQSAIHVYAKKAHEQPSLEKWKQSRFVTRLCQNYSIS